MHMIHRTARRAAVALALAAATLAPHDPALAQAAPGAPAVPVVVDKARRQDVPIWLRGLGSVQANYAVQVRPRVDGTLVSVPVREGQDVKGGELLAVIDPRPYQSVLDTAMAKKSQDQAQLENAKADLARYASLARQDFASRQQLDTQAALVRQYTATIAGDDAQIEAAQLNLNFCSITAPFDSRVGLRNVDPGNVMHASEATAIMSLTQIQPISVTFTLPQDSLPSITRAMAGGPLDVLVSSSDGKTDLDRGTLVTPDSSIDATTGTIKLKATFANAKRALWPGQFVNAALLLGVEKGVVTVPVAAVQHGPAGLFVYKLQDNGTVAVQPIEQARQEGATVVVAKGLEEGAQVVTDGQSRIQNGSRVAVRDLQPPGGGPTKSGS